MFDNERWFDIGDIDIIYGFYGSKNTNHISWELFAYKWIDFQPVWKMFDVIWDDVCLKF